MNNNKTWGNRNLPNLKISKNIYIFYLDDLNTLECLQNLFSYHSNRHSTLFPKYYVYDSNITYNYILKKINTPYHKYDKSLDKLCIIGFDKTLHIKNSKIQIEYFSNINHFQTWLLNYLNIS